MLRQCFTAALGCLLGASSFLAPGVANAQADVTGQWTRRTLQALELKVGPGKVLLGGIDEATQAYRGFRADRISRLQDLETSEIVDRNILDWLIRHADRQNRPRRRSAGQAA